MRIISEFIVLHRDQPMPNEEKFCPSLWQAKETDSDGDYYYNNNINGRWTHLEITKFYDSGNRLVESVLTVYVYWENNHLYEPGIADISDLKRFIDYKNQGRYRNIDIFNENDHLGVTSLFFETKNLVDYKEFLNTVYFYLEYSKGILVNFDLINAHEFKTKFLE